MQGDPILGVSQRARRGSTAEGGVTLRDLVTANRIASALTCLDVGSRALLELSIRRGLSDEEIADVMGVPPGEVMNLREEALFRIAAELGVPPENREALTEKLARVHGSHWRPETGRSAGKGHRAAGRRGRSRARLIAVGVLVAAGGALGGMIISSTGADDRSERTNATQEASGRKPAKGGQPATPAPSPPRAMQRLNGTYGRGTAQLRRRGRRVMLRLRVSRFLRPQGGGYAVWLFNSRSDARRLYATTDTTIHRDISLPADYRRFRFIEIARASPDLESAHTGLSLLRAPRSALERNDR